MVQAVGCQDGIVQGSEPERLDQIDWCLLRILSRFLTGRFFRIFFGTAVLYFVLCFIDLLEQIQDIICSGKLRCLCRVRLVTGG